jgi:hypothetical protein
MAGRELVTDEGLSSSTKAELLPDFHQDQGFETQDIDQDQNGAELVAGLVQIPNSLPFWG